MSIPHGRASASAPTVAASNGGTQTPWVRNESTSGPGMNQMSPGALLPYPTADTISKIGRYMATIIPPTTTPSTTIMMGSMAARRALTAASTSSS